MKRRSFLKLSGLGIAGLVALPGLAYVSTSVKSGAVGILLKEFKYLKLDEKGVEDFVNDFFSKYSYDMTYHLKIRSYYLLGIQSDKSSLVGDLANKYLLSTDFFRNRMDETKIIRYIGLYNPYQIPCSNPFSNIYYPSSVES